MACNCRDEEGNLEEFCKGLCRPVFNYSPKQVERAEQAEERIIDSINRLAVGIEHTVKSSYRDGFEAGFKLAKEMYD